MKRRTRPAHALLATLLALAVILNGIAIPAVSAMATTPAGALHARHHGHDGIAEQSGAGDPVKDDASDCCDGTTCGCGCTATQAAAPQPAAAPREWTDSTASPMSVNRPAAASPIGAPFRPPA